jgi:hypothetical protein
MSSPIQATDLVVKTANPELLDQTVQQLGPAAVVDGSWDGEKCRVRVFGDPGFLRFAITNQGYGEIVGESPADPNGADDAVR